MDDELNSNPTIRPEDIEDNFGNEVFADETLSFDDSDNKVWLVKIPKFLKEKWEAVDEDNVELGTLRVFNDNTVKVLLPDNNQYFNDVPKDYTLNVHKHTSNNSYIFGEKELDNDNLQDDEQISSDPSTSTKVNEPIATNLAGTIHHEGSLMPDLNDSYRSIMKKRKLDAITPKRTVKTLEPEDSKMATGGFNTASRFSSFIRNDKAKAKGPGADKATRMPRNELLDLLFTLFESQRYWNMRDLRERTQQPLNYLKETLVSIAHLAQKGPYHGHWYLQEVYQREHHDKVHQKAQNERQALEDEENENE